MGVFDSYKSQLAEEARQQAVAEEAARKLARDADRASLDNLSREAQEQAKQTREAAELNLRQVEKSLPLFETLDAKAQLADLIRIWDMGRVDKVPQYIPDGDYVSWAWRKNYLNTEVVQTTHNWDDGTTNKRYGIVARQLSFEIHVETGRRLSYFKINSPWGARATDWKVILTDPKALLEKTMLDQVNLLKHPNQIIGKTKTRHPFLLRLGFPDFDIPVRR